MKTDLAKGQSIADIAKAKKVDVNKVIDTLVGDASAKIDQAVKDGHLPKDQADKLKSMLKTAITNLVNNGFPKGLHGGGFGFGFGGHKGFGGPMPGANGGPNVHCATDDEGTGRVALVPGSRARRVDCRA